MSYIFLLAASFSAAFALGFTKFFGMTYLAEGVYSSGSKTWVIQAVGALMTLGPTLAYVLAGPFAASSRKWKVMFVGALGAAFAVMLGSGLADASVLAVWAALFAVGFSMGIFSAGKMSSAPLEAERGVHSIFTINAYLSVGFLGGILSGAYFGTLAYEKIRGTGALLSVAFFLLTAVVSIPCRYKSEKPRRFRDSLHKLGAETISLLLRFPLYLISSPLLWGIAGATALAMTAYAEEAGLGGAAKCSLMSLYAALGSIIGNLASPPMARHRFIWALGLCVGMTVLVAGMPGAVSLSLQMGIPPSSVYYIMAGYLVVLGFFFGSATNLVDAEYLRLVRIIGKEGEGAALQSAMISVFSFVIGGTLGICIFSGWLSPVTQFLILGLLSLAALAGFMALALISGDLNGLLRLAIRISAKIVLSIRYNIKIEGLEKLPFPPRKLLLLPNHPAEIDPVILTIWLWKHCAPRPVVTEVFFNDKLLGPIIRLTGAFAMPDMEAGSSRYKSIRIDKALSSAISALKSGDNVLMYPAGRLSSSGLERLGAASGVSRILSSAPETQVVMVRTRGLRGSSFSRATPEDGAPDFVRAAKAGFLAVLRNLVFLTPRRKIEITISIPENFPANEGSLAINNYLEAFYNAGGEEALELTPLDFWGKPRSSSSADRTTEKAPDISGVDPQLAESVRRSLSSKLQIEIEKIRPEARLAEDLGMDSLKKTEILILLEDEFFAVNVEMSDIKTVADVMLAASGAAASKNNTTSQQTPAGWIVPDTPPPVMPPEGSTLQESFLICCERMGDVPAMADDLRGVMTWRRMKIAVLLLADLFRKIPGDKLGIMLPASAGSALCIMAALMASKVPVMMNWTVGRKNLEAAARLSGIGKIITSGAFLDKLVVADFGEVESMLLFIEDLRSEIALPEKLFAAMLARRGHSQIIDELGLRKIRPEDPAVILFTSGSESSPKGVPLSHFNILSNLRSVLQAVSFNTDDVLLAMLPPFHSFGFSACSIFPMVSGLKVAYFPNPTDSRKVAEACRKWRATVLLGTPTFAAAILKAPKEDLETLRIIVVGAEKAPASLFKTVETLGNGAILIEGYGITECSPFLALNRIGDKPEGVGKPLPGIQMLVVDPETHKVLPSSQRGLLLVKGDNVFSGYLGNKPDPFLEIDGVKWYSTGDLGYLSPSGSLIIAGRIKRFVKVGGEMVSLPAIEEELSAKWPPGDEGPNFAVVPIEKEGLRPELVLFTPIDITRENANDVLANAGLSNIYRISKVQKLESLPILGSGKTDYQTLIRKLLVCLFFLSTCFFSSNLSSDDNYRYLIECDGLYGYIDMTGKVVVPLQYDKASEFNNGLAFTEKSKDSSYIDICGNTVISLHSKEKIYHASHFNDGIAQLVYENKTVFIDQNGKTVLEFPSANKSDPASMLNLVFPASDNFTDGLLLVKSIKDYTHLIRALCELPDSCLYGYMNKQNDLIINFIFDDANSFNNGFAAVKKDNKWGAIRTDGTFLISPEYDYLSNFKNGYAIMRKDGKYGVINSYANTVVNPIFDMISSYENGICIAKNDDKYQIISSGIKAYLSSDYDKVLPFKHGLALVKDDNSKYGFIDLSGKSVIPPIYDYAESFSEGFALVAFYEKKTIEHKYEITVSSKYGFIDHNSKYLVEPQYYKADSFYNGLARVYDKQMRIISYIDKKGVPVWSLTKYLENRH